MSEDEAEDEAEEEAEDRAKDPLCEGRHSPVPVCYSSLMTG